MTWKAIFAFAGGGVAVLTFGVLFTRYALVPAARALTWPVTTLRSIDQRLRLWEVTRRTVETMRTDVLDGVQAMLRIQSSHEDRVTVLEGAVRDHLAEFEAFITNHRVAHEDLAALLHVHGIDERRANPRSS